MPNSQRRRKKLLRAFPDVKLPFSLPVTHIFWNFYDNKAKAMNKISHWPVFKHSSLSSENSTNLVILSSLLPQLMVLLKTVEGLPAKSTWRLGEESSSEHLSTEVSQQFIHPPIFGCFFFLHLPYKLQIAAKILEVFNLLFSWGKTDFPLRGHKSWQQTCSSMGFPQCHSILWTYTFSNKEFSRSCKWISAPLCTSMGCRETAPSLWSYPWVAGEPQVQHLPLLHCPGCQQGCSSCISSLFSLLLLCRSFFPHS